MDTSNNNKTYSHASSLVMRSKFDAFCYLPDSEASFRLDLKKSKIVFLKPDIFFMHIDLKKKMGP